MTQITIDDGTGKPQVLGDAVVAGLTPHVARTNDANGTRYTTAAWIALHLQEIAIGDDLAAAIGELQKQQQADAQADLEAAIKAARDQLLAALAKP